MRMMDIITTRIWEEKLDAVSGTSISCRFQSFALLASDPHISATKKDSGVLFRYPEFVKTNIFVQTYTGMEH